MATQPVETSDEFDAAFAQFAAPDPAAAAAAPAGGDEPGDEPGGDAGGDGAPDASDPAAAPAGDGAGDTGGDSGDPGADAGAGDPPAAEPKPDDAATDALIARLAGLVKETPAPEPKADPAPTPAAEPEIYTADEKDFLAKYEEDWADVTRGEELKSRQRNGQLVKYVFEQIAQELRPYLDTIETLSTKAHLGDLRQTVGDDYDTVREKVVDWALSDQHPEYLRKAYKEVIQSGTAEEVNHLIGQYRAATGEAAKPTPEPAKQPELSDDAKKAAKALAPVSTKRSGIPQDDDKNDFDSAFQRFSANLNRS